jgi:Flp pilus assembly protein TadG
MSTRNKRQRGNALIEFTLLGIPMTFILISIVSISIGMWEYQNLAWAVDQTARYGTMHGVTCTENSNSCAINVGNMANYFIGAASALDPGTVSVSFTDGSGTATTCNPINSCTSNSAQFPGTAYNSVGSDIKVTASYTVPNPIALYWPGSGSVVASNFTVGATSRQRIEF